MKASQIVTPALASLTLIVLVACSTSRSQSTPRDYLLTAAKPDRLFVLDPATQSIKSEFRVPDARGAISTIVPSPDGKIAYMLVNKMESIVGMDLDTGDVVFRADLSTPTERVKSIYAFDVTPDGREIIVHELPTRLDLGEYHVEEPRFAVFDTRAGTSAKPVRQFPAPRRVHLLLAKKDGKSFYAVGFELYEYDVATGKLIGQRGIRSWERPSYAIPDLLSFWPVSEPTGIFSTPIYSMAGAAGDGTGGVAKTALMTLDLNTGELAYNDFEETAVLIFSTVMSPTRGEAFGVYSQLTKIDTKTHTLAGRVDLDHTFYSVNISSDGKSVYMGGTMCDVATYDAQTLEKKGNIKLPGCPDQSLATLRVIRR
jgi:quinohemoprotein amine dehydrogenase beta subunit